MKIIGSISGQNLADAWTIAKAIQLSTEVHSTYAPKRVESWFRFGSNLQSLPAGKGAIFLAPEPHVRITGLGDRLFPDWHSLLVCGGNQPKTSTTISWHRDHGHFHGLSLMLNLGEAIYKEQPDRYSNLAVETRLTDGLIVLIDTKLLHCAEQLSTARYNFTFRKIKQHYLPKITAEIAA